MPAHAVVMRTDGFTIDDLVREQEYLGIAGQGELRLRVIFRLAEKAYEGHEVVGIHVLAAQKDRAVCMKQVDDFLTCVAARCLQVGVEDFDTEARHQRPGTQFQIGRHRYAIQY